MSRFRSTLITVLVIAGVLTGACSSEGGSEAAATRDDSGIELEVVNIAFKPESVRIDTGTEVVWTNLDESVHHTVTSGTTAGDSVPGVSKGKPARPDGVFDGDLPDASSEFRFTFDKPGTYTYFCRVHPSMTGEVIVE